MTPEEVLALADRVEADIEGGPSPRPLGSVPHPLRCAASTLFVMTLSYMGACAGERHGGQH